MACNFTNLLPGSETSAHKMLSQDKPLGKVTYTVMASDWSHLAQLYHLFVLKHQVGMVMRSARQVGTRTI